MKNAFLQLLLTLISPFTFSQGTIIKYLSGTDKDHTVQWDFYCTGGSNSGKWTTIAVPSNWELQGFGTYNYGHDKTKGNEQGLYKHEFFAERWTGKKVFIVFEGSMTDTKVMINGQLAGHVHQGGFYQFKYDITGLIKTNAKNVLEVTVDKTSANASVNDAERRNSDFWVFGGIFRPVYLEIVPQTFIDRIAIDATADGLFKLDVYLQHVVGGETVEAQLQKRDGTNIGTPFSTAADTTSEKVHLESYLEKPLLWSSEFPNLYQVVITLKSKSGAVIHRVWQRFGFRTIELRANDGFYVNGIKVVLKGCCRHSFWPESGRTLSYGINLSDVNLMKQMNMNAVRMSHYPPDRDFLDICDSLGLYVLDELTGWQAKYDTVVGRKLVKELVIRDVNHPSIIFWDNGNEGGWNTGLDNEYALYDPQKRTVLHPWAKFNGADNHHYPDYNYLLKKVATGEDVFFPTEFLHGLYDGGAGAGLDDFWDCMMKYPQNAGGFIWAFLDEAVLRKDKNGLYDTDGNHAPDGIVGPHREKEASFYTIKEIWSPVYIKLSSLDKNFNREISVENRYAFTNLSQCLFRWKLVKFPTARDKATKETIKAEGTVVNTNIKPSGKGILKLGLPVSWAKNDALYLTAFGPDHKEIYTWTWPIQSTDAIQNMFAVFSSQSPIQAKETANSLAVKCDGIKYYFDKVTGYIQQVVKPDCTISLSGGPVLAGVKTELNQFVYQRLNEQYIIEANYRGEDSLHVKWTFTPGHPVKLEYTYSQSGDVDFSGITFNSPEEKMEGMKWLGRGPYRVWKNRLKGERFGVWHKAYNNTVTGQTWDYPEFKGYHGAVKWVVIENNQSPFTVYCGNNDVYLQMLHPAREADALKNNNVEPPFPEGSIGFLHAIAPIGTKFHSADAMGPQGQKNPAAGQPISGILWFDFLK